MRERCVCACRMMRAHVRMQVWCVCMCACVVHARGHFGACALTLPVDECIKKTLQIFVFHQCKTGQSLAWAFACNSASYKIQQRTMPARAFSILMLFTDSISHSNQGLNLTIKQGCIVSMTWTTSRCEEMFRNPVINFVPAAGNACQTVYCSGLDYHVPSPSTPLRSTPSPCTTKQ